MLGDRLRQARDLRGLSQRELARICNINQNQVHRYESEKASPSVMHLKTLAEVLNVTTDYLLGISNDPASSERQLTDDERYILDRFRYEGWRGLGYLVIDKLFGAQNASDDSGLKE